MRKLSICVSRTLVLLWFFSQLPAIALFSQRLATSHGQTRDWPQILGPNRNGVAVGQQIRRDWGDSKPAELWQKKVGQGLAGVAVARDQALLFHRLGNDEVVEALSTATGKTVWTHRWPTSYVSTISPDSGPRCVPVVHGDAVFAHGAAGQLVCMALADGKPRWQRDTTADFDVRQSYFGAGSTPIVAGDLLILNVGGRKNGGIVAFSLADGKTVWQVPEEQASYSSPLAANVDGVDHLFFVTRYNFLSVDPKNGMVRFRVPFGQRGPTVNGASPLLLGNHVFLTASYGIGARWVRIAADEAEFVWSRDDLMSSQYSTCVAHNAKLYGIDGRQDGPPGRLRCFDPRTEDVHWSEEDFGMATLIRAGSTLVVMKTDGQLVLVDANAKKYQALARWQLLTGTVRALPALANSRLFVRNESELKCFDLSKKSAQ